MATFHTSRALAARAQTSTFSKSFHPHPIVAAVRTQARAIPSGASRIAAPALLLGALALMPSAPAQAAELAFAARDITTTADGAISPVPADLDGDGDIDLVLGSRENDTVAWYENDGSQNYTQRFINTQADSVRSVFVIDLDLDGDLDVLSASAFSSTIAWYQNDGNQNFSARNISTSARGARSVLAADLDGDGDIDVASASLDDDKIAWYQNDGAQNFSTRVITTSADAAISVFASDVDGDGDTDLLSASLYDDKIAWYENDGAGVPSFNVRTITTSANRALAVHAADLDGDGDMDVASASYDDDKIAWYENDGNQNFAAHTIDTTANGAFSVFAADLDGDRDMDLLSGSFFDGKIAWYDNNGAADPSFTLRTISTAAAGAQNVLAADLDRDGDIDVVSGSRIDDTLAVYINQSSSSPSPPPPPAPPPPSPPQPSPAPPSAGPAFEIHNVRIPGECLQPEDGSPSVGDPMSTKICDAASAAQRVIVVGNPNGSARLLIDDLCVGTATGEFSNGARLQLQTCTGSVTQDFLINGTRFMSASNPNQVMDLHGQNLNDVIYWNDYGSTNQRWSLAPR